MKNILLILTLCSTQIAFAAKFTSKIHSFDFGKRTEQHLVRFENSRASFLNQEDKKLLKILLKSKEQNTEVEVMTDEENNLVVAKSLPPRSMKRDLNAAVWKNEPYRPTIVNSEAASYIFRGMRSDYASDSECYNRALVWAYEEYMDSKTNLMKIFMFFTERYIRKYKFEWWFHVTPMVYVGDENTPRTLDRKYFSGPRQTKVWSDYFIKSKLRCPIVKTFNDYYLNQETEDCYHVYTSMYYVVPRDIEKRDLTGLEKTEFIESEIRRGYRNGFGIDP